MIRAIIIAGLLLASTAAVADPITANDHVSNLQFGQPDHRGIAVDHVTIAGKIYTSCERQTPGGWVEVDCKTGREVEAR
jgi:hypothetical protein